ncbi:hypothetical protein LAZ67_15000066 [Cordylochernes scorpioides]|uniref:Uncharacterized protein n=1 Tax=Cordylochernes scorpioides TaxID=51811 RepID=A0ABY6LA87_9ARAC|nr:hypothetical protein LAZ67_15000066 [Cordylochernes scorpioides]
MWIFRGVLISGKKDRTKPLEAYPKPRKASLRHDVSHFSARTIRNGLMIPIFLPAIAYRFTNPLPCYPRYQYDEHDMTHTTIECMPYSDHLPLVPKFNGLNNIKAKDDTKFRSVGKYSWVSDKATSYKSSLRDSTNLLSEDSTIDSQVEMLTSEVQPAMSRAGMMTRKSST